MKCLFDYAAGLRKKKAVQYEFYMSETIFVVGGKIVNPHFVVNQLPRTMWNIRKVSTHK